MRADMDETVLYYFFELLFLFSSFSGLSYSWHIVCCIVRGRSAVLPKSFFVLFWQRLRCVFILSQILLWGAMHIQSFVAANFQNKNNKKIDFHSLPCVWALSRTLDKALRISIRVLMWTLPSDTIRKQGEGKAVYRTQLDSYTNNKIIWTMTL